MAKRRRPSLVTDSVDFWIDSPSDGGTVTADGGGMITVTINDNGSTDDFAAMIYLFAVGSGIGALQGGPTDFPDHDGSNSRSVSISVGPIDASVAGNNRVVQAEDKDTGRIVGQGFRVVSPGSSGSGSNGMDQQFLAKFCRVGQLVPIAVTLKLDAKVTKGTCAKCSELNRPTLLLHSREAKLANCWFSPPIAFCGKGLPAAYWVLKKNNAMAWTLVLQHEDKVVVTYTVKTKPKDCSLPITLQRKGAGSKACKDWPKTVTISPAP